MVFKEIKIDHTSRFGRTAKIYTKKGNFTTPNRSIIQTKLHKFFEANDVLKRTEDFFPNPLLEEVLDLSKTSLRQLHSINGHYKTKLKKLQKDVATYDKGPVLLFPRMKKDSVLLSDLDLAVIVDIQGESEVIDLAGIPDPCHGVFSNSFKELMTNAFKRLETKFPDLYPVPFIRLDQDRQVALNKIRWLLEQDLEIMSFVYIGDSRTGMYAVESALQDKKVWIHLSNLKKEVSTRIPIAIRNIRPLDGFDTVSAWKGYGGGGKTGSSDRMAENIDRRRVYTRAEVLERRKTAKSKDKFFSRTALGFLTQEEYLFRYGTALDCDCPICNKGSLDSRKLIERKFKDKGLPLEIHETVSSSNEIVKDLRIAIAEDNHNDYLLSKSLIKENRGSMGKYFPKPLNKYFSN